MAPKTVSAKESLNLPKPMRHGDLSLEEALEYIQADEYVEVTPHSLRLRKILMKEHERKRARNSNALMR